MLDYAREFLVLAKQLNFVRAAEALHVSQPTLTRHIAYLEQELGFKLFNRNPMALTAAGQSFCHAINGIIDQLDRAVDQGRRIAAENGSGILVNLVMSSNNKFADVIFEAMTLFHERFPYSPMPRLFQDHTMGIEQSVIEGKVDIGLVFTRPTNLPEGFSSVHLLDLPLMVYVHACNPLAERESIAVEDLSSCHLICPSNPYLQTTFEGAMETMREHGIEPRYRVREIDEFDRIPSTIQPDEMLFKTASHLSAAPPATFLVAKRFVDPAPLYHVYAVYRTDARDHAPGDFISICKSLIENRLTD
ncbi:LysR family transcriptional regulator [Adlercreutzia sp. R25]|uniref:LysR family transcriptional regulator n=1 Tax=Adlercreutzia shanghongiae TaxID=3111773 RepID=UPI002DBD043F|nr:LysR family transcriptional regulator [Adlercreutzia sp. R25]MEC4271907.1 LysR family transcriptional regulator [Adlercreutzia sp. R25]